jgi:rsbT co-antagonist protein RsbR
MASGVRLLGAVCVVSGIQPAVAQTLVSIGVELDGLVACHDMEHALRHCVGGA